MEADWKRRYPVQACSQPLATVGRWSSILPGTAGSQCTTLTQSHPTEEQGSWCICPPTPFHPWLGAASGAFQHFQLIPNSKAPRWSHRCSQKTAFRAASGMERVQKLSISPQDKVLAVRTRNTRTQECVCAYVCV